MITIDGSQGEGGGQILRSSLALSLVTGMPFTIQNIRAGREKPGLLRQHLTAVNAAVAVSRARVEGAAIGSRALTFEPGVVSPGAYHFAVGTAGSATLVLQTVLPALLCAADPSTLRLEGGTHNPWAPPFDFLANAFLPLINRMGPTVTAELVRPGFYPAGGGEFNVSIVPSKTLTPIDLLARGAVKRIVATAKVANLSRDVAERELNVIAERLSLGEDDLVLDEVKSSRGPGNVVTVEVQSEHLTEVFTGFGERRVSAEAVANKVCDQVRRYLSKEVAVGEYLTDQLMIPFALSGGGSFRTLGLSRHAETNNEVIKSFLGRCLTVNSDDGPGCLVGVYQHRPL